MQDKNHRRKSSNEYRARIYIGVYKREEELAQKLPYNLMVSYFDGEYDREEYLESIVKDARDLLRYNEWLVALENAVDNLFEADCRFPV